LLLLLHYLLPIRAYFFFDPAAFDAPALNFGQTYPVPAKIKVLFCLNLDIRAGILPENPRDRQLSRSKGCNSPFSRRPGPTAMTSPSCCFSLAESGMIDAAFDRFFFFNALHDHFVVQRCKKSLPS